MYFSLSLDKTQLFACRIRLSERAGRRCSAKTPCCLQLSVDNCPRLTIHRDTILGLVFRLYAEPATKVGPALTEILYDRVIKFSPRPSKRH